MDLEFYKIEWKSGNSRITKQDQQEKIKEGKKKYVFYQDKKKTEACGRSSDGGAHRADHAGTGSGDGNGTDECGCVRQLRQNA